MASRRSNKRKRRNRGRFGFLYKVLSLIIILVVIAAGCVVFFRVEDITVTGVSRYTAQEIIDASGVEKGDNLFLVGSSRTAQKIYSTLPYVDEVNIRHALPDGLVINVTERTPAAVIQGDEGWWIIDAKGKILEQVSKPEQAGVAEVSGLTALLPAVGTTLAVEDAEGLKLESLMDLLSALEQRDILGEVSSIDLSSAAEISMVYDGRLTVKMRMSDDFMWQTRVLTESMAQGIIQSNETGVVDLTLDQPRFIPKTAGS
ncbi:FtsQ-type POTRA domain-containing protein [uncultured Intestinimonas sp.]|uniref:cell division protein FtsQ/DivIB n=1 Tax=uncultured Intestinimonas sp. TaxID=1689265 RepID=UPI0025F4C754|nr:FtsQ-type POTRA domain-containing protein [uncultured Intestinimonas sp.]